MNFPVADDVIAQLLQRLKFDSNGLITAVAQDATNKDVLMVAMMSAESITATLREGRAVYYSRSRQQLWRKGDTSGHEQHVTQFSYDCDADCILLQVRQTGAACHTGQRTCFFEHVL